MNCSACGSPLQFDRVVFRCSCGAYVHAYCVDKHTVESHRPEMEEGYADLNGDFHPKHKPEPTPRLAESVFPSSSDEQQEDLDTDTVMEDETEQLVPGETVLADSESDTDEGDDSDEER